MELRHADLPEPVGFLLVEIRRDWLSVREEGLPWGVWVRLYSPLPPGADSVEEARIPERVWFLDEAGWREESVWKWMRFFLGCTRGSMRTGGERHEIALAALAPLQDGSYYTEVVWGWLFSGGSRWDPEPAGNGYCEQNLWRG